MSDRPAPTSLAPMPADPGLRLHRPARRRIAPVLLLVWLIGGTACSSMQSERQPLDPESLPTMSFLLPAPFSLNDSAGEFAREQSLRLFSAPVLDPGAIETLANRYEIKSREILAERQAQLTRVVCGLAPGQRRAAARSYEIQRQRQWNRWLNLQDRYESSLKYRLNRNVHPDDVAAQARLGTLLSAREAVRALQRERQQLITQSYERQLQALAERAPGGSDSEMPCDSPPPPAPGQEIPAGAPASTAESDRGAIAPGQPAEFLYLPYYLALYRFLSLLPPDHRSELLLALHSGKTSDN
ncbi:MAG: hypothetical protein NXI24_13960 [bacterium]|nr:hypothetical protein [bacterium]